MAYYESVKKYDTDGASLDVNPLLRTWTQVNKVFGFDPTAQSDGTPDPSNAGTDMDWLIEAYAAVPGDVIPLVGDEHPKYPAATVQRVAVTPQGNEDTCNLAVRIQWAQPGLNSQISYDVNTGSETRNYDADGNLCEIRYNPTSYFSGVADTNLNVPFITGVRVPNNARSICVTQYENISGADSVPSVAAESDIIFWNEDAIWGFNPGELLYVGRKATTDGTRLYRTAYYFLINRRGGWHHFYAVYETSQGLIPRDIVPYVPNLTNFTVAGVSASDGTIIYPGSASYQSSHPLPTSVQSGTKNGASAYKMFSSENFATYFNNIKPPFGVG